MNPLFLIASFHTHQCAICGTSWGHCHAPRSFAANRAAHTCPACGRCQYFIRDYPLVGALAVATLVGIAALLP